MDRQPGFSKLVEWMRRISRRFTPLASPGDGIQLRRANSLKKILSMAVILSFGFVFAPWLNREREISVYIILSGLFIINLGLYLGMGRVATNVLGVSFLATNFLTMTALIIVTDGVNTPLTTFYIILLLMAGLLFDMSGVIVMGAIEALTMTGLIVADKADWLRHYTGALPVEALYVTLFVETIILTYWTFQSLRQSLAQAEHEIAERKQAEAELRRHQEHLEELVAGRAQEIQTANVLLEQTRGTLTEAQKIAHLGSFEYVAATQTTVWSEEEFRIYGLDPAGRSPEYDVMLAKCIHPDDAALLHDTFTRAMQSKAIYELEHRIVRPDGSVRWVYDRAHPYFNEQGELVRYIGATLDTTERNHAEEALRESEKKYRELVKFAPVGIYEVDFHTQKFTSVNDLMCETLGYTRAELLDISPFDIMDPPSRELFVGRLQKWLAGATPVDRVEYRIHARDGRAFDVLLNVTFTRDAAGNPLGATVIAYDITERKRYEQSLQQLNDELDERVRARTAELQESEQTFMAVFHASPVALVIAHSGDGKYIEINAETERISGYSRAELLGKSTMELGLFTSPGLRKELALQGELRNVEVQARHKTDGWRWISLAIQPLKLHNEDCWLAAIVDIDERKRLDASLRESEERFRTLFEKHDAVMLLIEPNTGAIVDANLAAQKFYGYSHEQLQWMKIEQINMLPPEEVKQQRLRAVHESMNAFVFPHRLASGEVRQVEVHSSPITVNGAALLFSIIHDVTEKKRAEDALRASEYSYRSILEQASDGIFIADAQGTYVEVNPSACAMLGYTRAELLSRTMIDLIPTEDLVTIPFRMDELRQGKFVLSERRMIRKDGSIFPVEISARQLSDGRLQGIVRDITDRKRAEDAMHESEERYRLIGSSVSDYVFSTRVDEQGNMHHDWVAGAFAEITGYTLEEYIANGGWWSHVHPQDRDVDARDIANLYKNQKIISEIRTIKKDGAVIWVQVYAYPQWNMEYNRLTGIYGAVKDITARKQAEAEIQNLARFPSENPNPVLRLRQDGAILFANAASSHLLRNWGRSIGDLAPEFWQGQVRDAIAQQTNKSLDFSCGDIWYTAIIAFVPASGYVNLYLNDITARKRAEAERNQQLEELNRWYKATLGRESRILEMKHEVNALLQQAGQAPRYRDVTLEKQG